MPFIDVLEQNSKYTKFMKEILAKKRKLKEHKTRSTSMRSAVLFCTTNCLLNLKIKEVFLYLALWKT